MRRLFCGIISTAAAMLLVFAADSARADGAETVSVAKTFNDCPFEYRIKPLGKKTGSTVYRLTYPSPVKTKLERNNTIPADYYLPDGIKPGGPKRPAVICMHILDGDFELVEIICSVLASRGIPAIMFKLPYYGERGEPEGARVLADDPELFAEAMTQATGDLRRTIDVLASRPEVDPKHIGITGISLGSIVAATAAAGDPRLDRAFLMLAGGDLLKIIHHADETDLLSQMLRRMPKEKRAAIEAKIGAVDPLRVAAKLKDRAQAGRVVMINAGEDEVIPRECSEKLADALGIKDEIVWLDGLGHYTAMAELPRAMRMMTDFFGRDLPESVRPQPQPAKRKTPLQLFAGLLSQLAALATDNPPRGRCHFADLEISVTPKGQDAINARLRVVRGAGHKFKIDADVPSVKEIGHVAVGQGRYPWMASSRKVVFKGTENPGQKLRDPLALADPQQVTKMRMAAGAAAAVAIAPDLLLRWITAEDADAKDGCRAIRVAAKDKKSSSATLVFQPDGATPDVLRFEIDGAKGIVRFHGWQTGTVAHPSLFEPPADLPRKTVDQTDVYRTIASLFNFAMESIE